MIITHMPGDCCFHLDIFWNKPQQLSFGDSSFITSENYENKKLNKNWLKMWYKYYDRCTFRNNGSCEIKIIGYLYKHLQFLWPSARNEHRVSASRLNIMRIQHSFTSKFIIIYSFLPHLFPPPRQVPCEHRQCTI